MSRCVQTFDWYCISNQALNMTVRSSVGTSGEIICSATLDHFSTHFIEVSFLSLELIAPSRAGSSVRDSGCPVLLLFSQLELSVQ